MQETQERQIVLINRAQLSKEWWHLHSGMLLLACLVQKAPVFYMKRDVRLCMLADSPQLLLLLGLVADPRVL